MGSIDTSHLNITSLGITDIQQLHYNLPYEDLYNHELDPSLEGDEKGFETSSGAIAVNTGKFTGRSAKDKYFIVEDTSKEHIWWGEAGDKAGTSDNKPLDEAAWPEIKKVAVNELSGKTLYIMDGFAGTNPDTRLNVRLVTEVAWMAHFFKNMFIRPTEEELKDFKPDWTILNACKTTFKDYAKFNMRSEVCCVFNIKERQTVILGTWYGGEIKKGIFTMMNYFLPLKGVGAFHCSANEGEDGDTALFFGLSGTGKTSLSTDPKRKLIGDDEHGWDNEGVFNFEGGCYAKCIGLTEEREPEIYHAIKRDALLENIVMDEKGVVDFDDTSKTQNTRVSYPIYHIENIVKPLSKGTHPKNIIFLTCDAFGVLPPVAKLTKEQAMYHYLSGYTAKVAGTELGVKEPTATFSACFGHPFLPLHPTKYAQILAHKMEEHGSKAYLINTGWVAGKYGVGHRIPLVENRRAIDNIFSGAMESAEYEDLPILNLHVPKSLPDVDESLLNPRDAWENREEYDATAKHLAEMFIQNFKTFTDTEEGKRLVSAGPQIG